MPYSDLAAELVGTLPGLSPFLAETYISRAWQDVCNARLWSFLRVIGAIPLPAQITAGTVTTTLYTSTLTCDAAASAALTPYIAGTPLLTQMQIRTQGQSLYTITAVDNTVPTALVLTLDQPFVGPVAGVGQAYQVYRAYIQAPTTNFLRWESLNDFQNGYAITGDRLSQSSVSFDNRDPQRQSMGQAYFLGEIQGQLTGAPIWELWPHPTDGQTFIAAYRSKGTPPDFSDPTNSPPPIVPDQLIVTRALAWYGYQWAQANRGAFPRYAKYDFMNLIQAGKQDYLRTLLDVKRIDDEQALQTVYSRGQQGNGSGLLGPADSKYWQSHPITW